MTKLDKSRILKYLAQAEKSGEHQYLVELFSELEIYPEFSDFLKNDWNNFFDSDNNVNKDLSGVLNRLHKEIENIEETDKKPFIKRLLNTYSKAAAILLLPLLAASIYLYSSKNNIEKTSNILSAAEIHAPENSRVKYILPDSSVVWINSGSYIRFASGFSNKRHIDLTGKAYFEVTHDTAHPFSVSFVNGNIEVLGTKFSVTSNDNGNFAVTLVEGKVKAHVSRNNKSVILAPNQMLMVNDTGLTVKDVNAANEVAWVDGKLIFRDTPFSDVTKKLSEWYNVDISIKDNDLKDLTYRGMFKDESLDNVLKLMSMTLPIKYKELPRHTDKNGNFERQKILISSNK
jgi:ferric-dicitrate binding protein FerR (iron transport regulator)